MAGSEFGVNSVKKAICPVFQWCDGVKDIFLSRFGLHKK